MLKISFIAPSCYGKSTAIKMLSDCYDLKNIKIAEPLYELQSAFYRYINKEIEFEQDGELLQFLGAKIRKENPAFLIDTFTNKVNASSTHELITNDDCRPPDYIYLKKLGFKFVLINGFRRDRQDHTLSNSKSNLEWNESTVNYDYVLDNLGTIEEYHINIDNLMREIGVNEYVKRIKKK